MPRLALLWKFSLLLSIGIAQGAQAFPIVLPLQHLEEEVPPPPAEPGQKGRWGMILPAFVIHGTAPTEDVIPFMPRRLDPDGRSVLTPGIGVEYRGPKSLNLVAGYVRDCYDDPAGTIQVGQHFPFWSRFNIGYTVGLYIRQTPMTCYTTTKRVAVPGPRIPGIPVRTNTITSTNCGFADNLPLRYTFKVSGDYVDVIPSPFINLAVALFKSENFDVEIKLMSNFYLNELGLSVMF